MGNLFSSFDPNSRIFIFNFRYRWVSSFRVLIFIPQGFWIIGNQISKRVRLVIKILMLELSAIFGGLVVPGVSVIFLSFFFFIVSSNLLGLSPYVFTPSRHLVFTLTLSLPLWLGSMLWARVFQFNSVMAHLVPLGTPVALMPAIVLIETVRSIIRPITLAVRLAANMIAGHLLLTLLGGQGSLTLRGARGVLGIFLLGLVILELAVACIQSYVFTVLRSLYLNELRRVGFSKKFI